LVVDVVDFVRKIKASDDPKFGRGLPMFACGISLGGCIATRAANMDPSAFEGVVLLAPMLSLEKLKRDPINKVLRFFSVLLDLFVPSLECIEVPKNTMFPLLQVGARHTLSSQESS
jgi:acylglycerol lipase